MRGGPGSTRSYSSGLTRTPSAGSIVHALHVGQNLLPSLMGTFFQNRDGLTLLEARRDLMVACSLTSRCPGPASSPHLIKSGLWWFWMQVGQVRS
jgi:hypothetical protein